MTNVEPNCTLLSASWSLFWLDGIFELSHLDQHHLFNVSVEGMGKRPCTL